MMVTEVAIFVPSVAQFRADYLQERVRRAEIAALTVLSAPDRMINPKLEVELLLRAEVLNVVIASEGVRQLVLTTPDLPPVLATYDLREASFGRLVLDTLARLSSTEKGVIRIISQPRGGIGDVIEITVETEPLR